MPEDKDTRLELCYRAGYALACERCPAVLTNKTSRVTLLDEAVEVGWTVVNGQVLCGGCSNE